MELYLHFQAFDQKASFTKYYSFLPRRSKLLFNTRNEIILTGNGIISPTSWSLNKNFCYKMFLISTVNFKTGTRIIWTGNEIISSTSGPLIKIILLQREGFKKKWNLSFWLNLCCPLPRPPIWALLSGRFFYCFIQIFSLQNMKQLHGEILAHLIYLENYGQNYWLI